MPIECRLSILEFVAEPRLTARVDRACHRLSQNVYDSLWKRYLNYPRLKPFLASIDEALPVPIKVKTVFYRIFQSHLLRELFQIKKCLSPVYLDQAAPWSSLSWNDKISALRTFCSAVERATGRELSTDTTLKMNNPLIEGCEKVGLLESWLQKIPQDQVTCLEIDNFGLKHLPPHLLFFAKKLTRLQLDRCELQTLPSWIKQCSSLVILSLAGNRPPLSPDNVIDVCKNLPKLQMVYLKDHQDEVLFSSLKENCPHLTLHKISFAPIDWDLSY